jgi:hypothetical protein
MVPGEAQLVVCIGNVFAGRAGEQQFQYAKGTLGKLAARTAQYFVEVVRPWATIEGGLAPSLQSTDALAETAALLWEDSYVVWSTLMATAMGGVTPSPAPIPQDNLMIGPAVPRGPAGGLAGYQIEVQIQM